MILVSCANGAYFSYELYEESLHAGTNASLSRIVRREVANLILEHEENKQEVQNLS